MTKEVTDMSQVLHRQRSGYRAPVRRQSHALDFTLIALGALAALVGAYFQFAPENWWLAHFSQSYHLWSYIVGGLFAAAGFGLYADRSMTEDGVASVRTIAGFVLAVAALVGVVVAALAL